MQKERPLSPHLTVYKPQITTILSILNRVFGSFMAISTPVLIAWLMAIASGPEAYHSLQACFSHWFFKLFLLAWAFAFFFHMSNGIRHLFWDAGQGYDLETLTKSGYAVVASAVTLTLITLFFALTGGA
jgi:succinate dehydrogenase / fumarate reductase cytochrome b subunit